jgi:hypothetical protein
MDCTLCRHLESELGRLDRNHTEKAGTLRESGDGFRGIKHRSLQVAENDSLLNLEIARAELNRHKRNEHGTG